MGLSLAAGIPWLNHFRIAEPVPVLVISGESGMVVLQQKVRCFCQARDIKTPTNLFWGKEENPMPQFASRANMTKLSATIKASGARVVIIDPAYFCLEGLEHGDVFEMGTALGNVNLACKQNGATLVLLHHLKKPAKGAQYDEPVLSDLTQAGFREFARQWILLWHRSDFIPEGVQCLGMKVGGAGYGNRWALTVDEGTYAEPSWHVTVTPLHQKADTSETVDTVCAKLQAAIDKYPDGISSRSKLFEAAGIRKSLLKEDALEAMLADGRLVACKVQASNRQSYDGFKPGQPPEKVTQ